MELYDKLTAHYPAVHFSVSQTQTVIEEDEPQAATRSITFEHSGTDVLKINKSLFVAVRDEVYDAATVKRTSSPSESVAAPAEVCDGALATESPTRFLSYVELKSACTAGNVLKARRQILASRQLMNRVAKCCEIPLCAFIQQGIIVTQPITDETLTKARQRRRRDDDLRLPFSSSRFLLNLIGGKAVDAETGMKLWHFSKDNHFSIILGLNQSNE